MKKILVLMICVAMVLGGCGSDEFVFLSCDLEAKPKTLDAQFAERKAEQMIIANVFEGLVSHGPNGDIEPACAEKWDISSDGLTYTFTLRDDIFWSNGEKVVADDFLFAFERVFSPDSPSPYFNRYNIIKNASAVMAGEAQVRELGVKAPSDDTLVITLERQDTGFLELLSHTPAMPCNREFFASQKGRYGLDKTYLLTNGAFELYSWGSETVKLRRDENYRAPADIDGIDFYLASEDAVSRFYSGETDVCLIGYDADSRIVDGKEYYDKSWSLILNPNSEAFSDKEIRMAVMSTVAGQANDRIMPPVRLSDGVVPPAAKLGAINYRVNVGGIPEAEFADDARAAMLAAFEQSGTDRIAKATLLVCETAPGSQIGSVMQRAWQDTLSVYFNMQPLGEESLVSKLKSGNFDMAIAPISAPDGDRTLGLSVFANLLGEEHEITALIEEGKEDRHDNNSAQLLAEAERRITEEYIAMPLYDTPTVFALADGVSGVRCDAATGLVYFKDASRAK